VHLLVIPKSDEYRDVTELAAGDPKLLAHLVEVAKTVAAQAGQESFRLIFNTGLAAGQTVFHVHAHVLAGGGQDERGLAGGQQDERGLAPGADGALGEAMMSAGTPGEERDT
jgi:histidine triad (HIT) family protein